MATPANSDGTMVGLSARQRPPLQGLPKEVQAMMIHDPRVNKRLRRSHVRYVQDGVRTADHGFDLHSSAWRIRSSLAFVDRVNVSIYGYPIHRGSGDSPGFGQGRFEWNQQAEKQPREETNVVDQDGYQIAKRSRVLGNFMPEIFYVDRFDSRCSKTML